MTKTEQADTKAFLCPNCGWGQYNAAAQSVKAEQPEGKVVSLEPAIPHTRHLKHETWCHVCNPPVSAPDFYEAAELAATPMNSASAAISQVLPHTPLRYTHIVEGEVVSAYKYDELRAIAIELEQRIAEQEREIARLTTERNSYKINATVYKNRLFRKIND